MNDAQFYYYNEKRNEHSFHVYCMKGWFTGIRLFVLVQQGTIRAGILLLILIVDEEYADQPCHYLSKLQLIT